MSVGRGPVRRRSCSLRQFARPAVVLSVLDQTSLIPPVAAERAVMRPEQRVVSSSVRKAAAISCLRSENAFRAARMALTFGVTSIEGFDVCGFFTGLRLVVGFFLGLVVGDS